MHPATRLEIEAGDEASEAVSCKKNPFPKATLLALVIYLGTIWREGGATPSTRVHSEGQKTAVMVLTACCIGLYCVKL